MIKSLQNYAPSLGQCWLILFAVFIGQILAGFFMKGCPQSLVYTVSIMVPLIYIFFMAGSRHTDGMPRMNNPRFGKLNGVVTFLILALMMISLSVIIDPLSSMLPMPERVKEMFKMIFYGPSPLDLIISTCICAPILEEFICRGVIMRGLSRSMSPVAAIVWSSVLFAIMHANPWQAFPAFILGAFFGWIYHTTGCLWITIGLHALNNLISSILALKFPDVGIDVGLMDMMGSNYWYLLGAATVLFILLLYFFYEKVVSPEVRADS